MEVHAGTLPVRRRRNVSVNYEASYEAGAKYALVFNYAKDMNGTYGTLQHEHFEALQRFWNEVSPQLEAIRMRSVKAEAAFVLPRNYRLGHAQPSTIKSGVYGKPR